MAWAKAIGLSSNYRYVIVVPKTLRYLELRLHERSLRLGEHNVILGQIPGRLVGFLFISCLSMLQLEFGD